MTKILIYDDEANVSERIRRELARLKNVKKAFGEPAVLEPQRFSEIAADLRRRQGLLRTDGSWTSTENTALDEASIFIVDYDLLGTARTTSFATGEEVAYAVRCFSKCDIFIGVNQFGHNLFDLTLQGHPDSFADLNVGDEQIGNPGLWGGTRGEFCPWYWPNMPEMATSFDRRVKDALARLYTDEPLCEMIGLPKAVCQTLPSRAVAYLAGDPAKMTVWEFVRSSGNGLRRKDAENLPNKTGRHLTKNDERDDQIFARIAAARISKWLERLVLPGQDILVDAPHLVSRYPSLLTGEHARKASWDKTSQFAAAKDLGIDWQTIEDFRVKKSHWLSRPAWLWGGVRECQAIPEVTEPWKTKSTTFVFCEDTSSFHREKDCAEFTAELDSPFVRRHVKRISKEADYQPTVRISG